MIYKEYFTRSEFEDVWRTLQTYYNEPDGLKHLYKTLFYTIRNLPVDEEHSATQLRIVTDFENMIHVAGAPDPVEWLTGRGVVVDKMELARNYSFDGAEIGVPTVADMAAHLLYWSTLYDFRTQTRYHKDFVNYMDELENGTVRYSMEDPEVERSIKHKKCYYWKDTVAHDSAICGSNILKILRKRIEYHIGYHRYTDRFVNSRHYVRRMELCCRLLDLAASYSYGMEGIYVNTRNASRFIGPIFSRYNYESLAEEDNEEYVLSELRRAKAYKILWQFLDHNLPRWWD